MSGAEATSEEIRRLVEDEGLAKAEVAERMSVPESVVAAWLSRNDVDLDEQGSAEGDGDGADAKSDFPGAAGEVFRCSRCKDTIPVAEADEHDEQCGGSPDWRVAR